MSFLIIVTIVMLCIGIVYSRREDSLNNRIQIIAKILGIWFVSLLIWVLVGVGIFVVFQDTISKKFDLSGPDDYATILSFFIWSSLILSLLSTWWAVMRFKI